VPFFAPAVFAQPASDSLGELLIGKARHPIGVESSPGDRETGLRRALNGDIFIAESEPGRIRVMRAADGALMLLSSAQDHRAAPATNLRDPRTVRVARFLLDLAEDWQQPWARGVQAGSTRIAGRVFESLRDVGASRAESRACRRG
jgi:hypothetical protein